MSDSSSQRKPLVQQAGVKEATPEEIKAFLADPKVPEGLKTAMASPQLTNAARTQIMNQYQQKNHTTP